MRSVALCSLARVCHVTPPPTSSVPNRTSLQVGPLGLIAEVPLLKEHGVDKIYQLLAEPLVTDLKNIVYLVRPNTEYMDMIATQV